MKCSTPEPPLAMRPALFWIISQRVVVISYRHFWVTCGGFILRFWGYFWSLRMGRMLTQKNAVLSYFAVEACNLLPLGVITTGHKLLHAQFHAQATLTVASVTVQVRWSLISVSSWFTGLLWKPRRWKHFTFCKTPWSVGCLKGVTFAGRVKVKLALEQAKKAQRRIRSINLLFL